MIVTLHLLQVLPSKDTRSISSAFLKLLLKLAFGLLLRVSSGDTSRPSTLGAFISSRSSMLVTVLVVLFYTVWLYFVLCQIDFILISCHHLFTRRSFDPKF